MPTATQAATAPAAPHAQPPMQGGTLLLVEDSHTSADCVRLMFRGAGARLRRAECLRSARRHLALYTPDAGLVDLGLPDGSGLELIAQLARDRPRPGLIAATSGLPELEADARAAGADRFLAKPFAGSIAFRQMLGPVFHGLRNAGAPLPEVRSMAGMRDDLYFALDMLNGCATPPAYALQFIIALARVADDSALDSAARALQAGDGDSDALAGLLRARLQAQPLI